MSDKKIVKYVLVSATQSNTEFNTKVNEKLQEGFQPYGSPFTLNDACNTRCQAMVKYGYHEKPDEGVTPPYFEYVNENYNP